MLASWKLWRHCCSQLMNSFNVLSSLSDSCNKRVGWAERIRVKPNDSDRLDVDVLGFILFSPTYRARGACGTCPRKTRAAFEQSSAKPREPTELLGAA